MLRKPRLFLSYLEITVKISQHEQIRNFRNFQLCWLDFFLLHVCRVVLSVTKKKNEEEKRNVAKQPRYNDD